MTRPHPMLILTLLCFPGVPALAQTQIGGGACNSSSLNGTYSLTMTGRQISSGNFSTVFQANGSATFDGQNKVGFTMMANTSPGGVANPVSWSGTYSIQANCAGVANITTGDSTTLNLAVYNQGKAFLVTGLDATYSYTGGGGNQPTGCLASFLSGVYAFNGTGYTLSGTAVNGIGNATGLLQFDGQSGVTANFTLSAAGQTPSAITLTGTYSVSAACLGSATLTDSKSNSYTLTISITNSNKVSTLDFDLLLAQASKWMIAGSGHAIYGQPAANAAVTRPVDGLSAGRRSTPLIEAAHRGD